MLVLRGYRYRIYPSEEVSTILLEWERIHKNVWNGALSARCLRHKKFYPDVFGGPKNAWLPQVTYLKQQAELTRRRSRSKWVGIAPCRSEQVVLRKLDAAWKMWQRDPEFGRPRYKGDDDSIGMTVMVNEFDRDRHIRDGKIRLPKQLGWVDINMHRSLPEPKDSEAKSVSIVREGDEWFVSILFEIRIDDPGHSTLPVVGIDRGVVINIADSDGRVAHLPDRIHKLSRRIDRLKSLNDAKLTSPTAPRSSNWKKGQKQIAKLQKRAARMRRYWLHEQALYYAKNYGVVVVENLKIKNMTKSSKGTVKEPGKRVNQKSGLNRSILEQGWYGFVQMLCYKMEERGGIVVKVPPHHTSQTCSVCGHTSPDNRKSQSKFKCVSCGFQENADVNAAKAILQKFERGEFEVEGGYKSKKAPKKKLSLIRRQKSATAIPRGKEVGASCPPAA